MRKLIKPTDVSNENVTAYNVECVAIFNTNNVCDLSGEHDMFNWDDLLLPVLCKPGGGGVLLAVSCT